MNIHEKFKKLKVDKLYINLEEGSENLIDNKIGGKFNIE